MNNLIRLTLILALFLSIGCTPKSDDKVAPPVDLPRLTSLVGSTIRIKTTDTYELVESAIILTENGQPIPDGSQFNLVATGVTISSTINNAWQTSLIVSSLNGKFKFYVKPFTVAGLYRVNAYPVENSMIEFDQGLNARFFIDVAPGNPASMGEIKTEQFEDKSSYNNIKDLNENWIVTANPDMVSYISVGPIQDPYSNLLDEGTIGLSVNSGEILSENPARIISGYAYFAYKTDGIINSLNTQASLFHSSNINLNINSTIKKASPQLGYSANADFSNMTIGATRCQVISLTNNGAMAATNLDLSSSFPFNLVDEQVDETLCPLTTDVCRQRQSLKSGESCKVRIKFQMPNSGSVTGDLIAQMSPNEFSGALVVQRLRTDAVSSAQLATVNSFISFGGTQCATNKTLDIVVENIGDFDATNVSVVNPPPNLNQSTPFYSIILPPPDAILNPNLSTVVNCGTTFPAHRRCRVQVSFNPTVGITNQALLGRIIGDNINPLILTVSGYTIPGQGLNTFPIDIITPNNSILPLGMFLSSSQQSRIEIGPVVDACNQKVADGTILTASVTAGNLSNATFVTNNGSSTIYWNGSNNPLHLGNQVLTVNVGTGGSKNSSLFFRGINLSLSGSSSFGQVIEGRPKNILLTLTNNGNIDANNLSFSTGSPFVISDQGTCASGTLVAGSNCVLTVTADPQGTNQDLTINVNVNSATVGINSVSHPISINARTKPILTFDNSVYLFNDGSSGSYFERTVTLTNSGPSISYNTSISVDNPFIIQSSTCSDTLNVNQSCQIILRLNLVDVNNAVGKTISVSNEIDTNFPVANLGFSLFEINQQSFLTLQDRCVGPINFKIIGSSGTSITVANSVTANLVSNLSGIFYSSPSCDSGTEITQSSISSGNSQSSHFYYKNSVTGIDNIEVANVIISSGTSSIQINPEINLNVPSPNALVSNEELILIATGGYGSYTYNFSDGLSTSSLANIVNIPDPEDSNLTIGRKLVVLAQSGAGSKIVRVTDTQGFYKDFTFNLYPPLTVTSSLTVRSSAPVSLIYNDYGNPNIKTFTLQHYIAPNYVNGSLYGSSVNSSGVYSSGSSIPITTEYVLLEIPKATGGSSSARITLNINIEWPYGTLGDLIINSGQSVTLNSAQSYDYNTIWVKSGGTLFINQVSGKESEPVYLGSVNNLTIDGTISFKTYFNEDSSIRSYSTPDNRTLSYQNVLSRGGYGGSPQCGFATGGGGGAPFGGGGGSTLSNGYTTGPHGSSAGAFYGGATYPVYAPNNCTPNYRTISCTENIFGFCSEPDGTYRSTYVGGLGGNAGMSGGVLYLKSHGQIIGSGVINLNGNNGSDGGGASWSICNPNSGVTPNSTGRGGGGGGGGNGGRLFYRSTNTISGMSILTSAGSGGQPGASPYNASCTIGGGHYPSAGTSGYPGYIQKVP